MLSSQLLFMMCSFLRSSIFSKNGNCEARISSGVAITNCLIFATNPFVNLYVLILGQWPRMSRARIFTLRPLALSQKMTTRLLVSRRSLVIRATPRRFSFVVTAVSSKMIGFLTPHSFRYAAIVPASLTPGALFRFVYPPVTTMATTQFISTKETTELR